MIEYRLRADGLYDAHNVETGERAFGLVLAGGIPNRRCWNRDNLAGLTMTEARSRLPLEFRNAPR